MFGGDEVSAIVIDVGSHSVKAGYAGEDAPEVIFPSHFGRIPSLQDSTDEDNGPAAKKTKTDEDAARISVAQEDKTGKENSHPNAPNGSKEGANGRAPGGRKGLFVGSTALGFRRDFMEVQPALKDGIISDWDAVEAMWDHAMRDRLSMSPSDYAVLLAEPSFNPPTVREKMVQLMFEKNNCPALFLARNAVLTSFACGKSTALVVDSGGGSTTVAAVHDGYVLQKSISRLPIGGDLLSLCLQNALEAKGATIRPRFAFRRKQSATDPSGFEVVDVDVPNTTDSFRRFAQRGIMSDLKESLCRIPDTAFEESSYANVPTVPYELPDGQTIEVGLDRFRIPELLFNPRIAESLPGMEKWVEKHPTASLQSIPRMIADSISKCDADVRKDLFASILLSGGSSMFPQFKERLERELVEETPQGAKVKVLASGNPMERKFSVWIGGSILASLGSFQQMWLSKAEYEEHGPQYVHRKCP